jgi:hypothetical protein
LPNTTTESSEVDTETKHEAGMLNCCHSFLIPAVSKEEQPAPQVQRQVSGTIIPPEPAVDVTPVQEFLPEPAAEEPPVSAGD